MKTLVWLGAGGCGGCSMSLLTAEAPDCLTALELAGIELLWHPSLSALGGALLDSSADNADRIVGGVAAAGQINDWRAGARRPALA